MQSIVQITVRITENLLAMKTMMIWNLPLMVSETKSKRNLHTATKGKSVQIHKFLLTLRVKKVQTGVIKEVNPYRRKLLYKRMVGPIHRELMSIS